MDSRTLEAFLLFFGTFSLAQQPSSFEDLADGTVLHGILSAVLGSESFSDR
jgi:hypothetical protein